MEPPSILLPGNDKLFQALRIVSQRIQELFEKYSVLRKNNESLTDEIKGLRGEISYCTSKVKNVEEEKEEIAKEYLKYKEENDYKNQLIKDYEIKLNDLQKQNLKLKSEFGNINDECGVIKNKYELETKNLSNLIFEKEEIIKERALLAERLKEEILGEKQRNETKIKELLFLIEEKDNLINEITGQKSEEESLSEKNEILRNNVKLKIDQVIEKINSLVN